MSRMFFLRRNLRPVLGFLVVGLFALSMLTGFGSAPAEETVETATPPAVVETEAPAVEEGAAETVVETEAAAKMDTAKMDTAAMLADRVLGDENAPVTIIEYASMTCSHCADFHNNILPKVKAAYIDTGKVKLIMRDFPLDRFAVAASKMARCADPDQYHNLVAAIFANQTRWKSSNDPMKSLAQIGRLAGVSKEDFDACMGNMELENGILQIRQSAQSMWEVRATPTFIFNNGDDQFQGAQPFENFKIKIDKLLAK